MGIFKPQIDKLMAEKDIKGLVKALKNSDRDIRERAFAALKSMADKSGEVIEAVKAVVEEIDPRLRAMAALMFAESNDAAAYASLKKLLIAGAVKDKVEVLRVIADHGEKNNLDIANNLFLALNDKKEVVQLEAIRSMGILRDPFYVMCLSDKLNEKMYKIRLEAAKALSKIGGESSVAPLIGALLDSNSDVRLSAKEGLTAIGTPEALTALNDAPFQLLMAKMNESSASRESTIIHIGKMKLAVGIPLLRKACYDDYKSIRMEALKSLSLLRDKESLGTIIKLLDDKYWDVRLEAVRALGNIGDMSGLAALEKAANDANKNVRDEAKKNFFSMKVRSEKSED